MGGRHERGHLRTAWLDERALVASKVHSADDAVDAAAGIVKSNFTHIAQLYS